ncbi:uncharacterized protein BX664DRAFT_317688 [Halteromyces radiatus]|uniref:uncharacterized protein n=1 Tax=Halteromyces radiatus TaxID=101107 RepID=UPI00221E73B3|nr:uncharacterized protein BX664DRAFT_317688 [Halteromyces radiatus]KAI8079785.1 hypothetical protein BX664DRAFT_317688 [Halteromyces radiatus]
MYRILLLLSLCLCILSAPIDKKQSLGVNDQMAPSLSELLINGCRHYLEAVPIIKSGPLYEALLDATRRFEQASKNQVPANTAVPKIVGRNDQTAQRISELLKYVQIATSEPIDLRYSVTALAEMVMVITPCILDAVLPLP